MIHKLFVPVYENQNKETRMSDRKETIRTKYVKQGKEELQKKLQKEFEMAENETLGWKIIMK